MSYSSPLLTRPGAVRAGGLDDGVASHYGDPLREQRLLADGSAVVDLSHRGIVTVTGPDRLSWLNSLSSQLLLGLEPGTSTETLLLTVQGRIEYDARVLDDGSALWLMVEAGQAAGLCEWLTRMKFMLRVDVADVSAEWAVIASTRALAGWEDRPLWEDPWPRLGAGGFPYTESPPDEHPGFDRPWFEYLVPAAELADAVDGLLAGGKGLAGVWAAEALRIAAWRPRFGTETDERTIPHELDLIRTAVHLSKGCYKGQETVARVHNLGHPPRRLVFLHLDGSAHTLPAAGSAVTWDGRQVGTVTSVALHYEMGPVALAVIKRSVEPGVDLTVDDGGESYAAAQEVIVSPESGRAVSRPTGFLRGPRQA